MTARDHALQVNDIRVVELAHDASFCQKVQPVLVRRSSLECLYRNCQRLQSNLTFQLAFAHVAEFS